MPATLNLFKRWDNCETHGSWEVCTSYTIGPWKLGVGITIAVLAILKGVIQLIVYRRKKRLRLQREMQETNVEMVGAADGSGDGKTEGVQSPPPTYMFDGNELERRRV